MLCQYKEGKCVRGLGPFRNKDVIYCKQERPCGSLLSKNYQNMVRANMGLRANMGNENNYIARHNTNNNTNKRHKKPKSHRRNGKSSTRRRR
jgi:hypothetical protein